jgi:hypothetical protein
MAGAYTGGRLAAYIPAGFLLTAFALMMLATAAAMIRGRSRTAGEPVPHELPVLRVVVDGVAVGLVTGLVGAGGGFLVVPALALLGGLPMPVAVGTSLVVIAMKSFAGFAGYLSGVPINWGLAGAVTLAAVAGSLLGARLTGRIPADVLRKAFGWFVVVMGVFVLAQQSPAEIRGTPWFWAALAVLAAGAASIAGVHRRSSRGSSSPVQGPMPLVAVAVRRHAGGRSTGPATVGGAGPGPQGIGGGSHAHRQSGDRRDPARPGTPGTG